MVNIRYMVDDVDAGRRVLHDQPGIRLAANQSPAFADVTAWRSSPVAERTSELCRSTRCQTVDDLDQGVGTDPLARGRIATK